MKCSFSHLLLGAATAMLAVAAAPLRADSLTPGGPPPYYSPNHTANYFDTRSRSDFNLPQIGEAGANVLTPAQEYQIGLQVMSELREAGVILDDPLIHEYIDSLGHQLSSHSDNPTLHFDYFVISDPVVNAVTLPGGFIGVNSGLILDTDTEDELAGVMAHETSHVTQRHLARSLEDQKNRSLLNIATILGAILVAANTADPDVAMGTLATAEGSIIQHQITFTRSQEEEADRVGIQTLARAGFPPQGMIEFFQKMQRNDSLNGYDRIPEFLLDHPLDMSRMAYLQERAESLHVPPRPDSRSYALMKARLRVLESTNPDKTLQFFAAGVKTASGWNQVAMHYGLALSQSRVNQTAQAVAGMQQLADQYDDVVAFRIGLADAQMAANQPGAAEATYLAAMQLFPDSTPLTLSYARDLIEAGQPERAVALLLPLSVQPGRDPEVLRLIAKASEKSGNPGDSHYYMSEYYLANSLPSAAATQLRIALATPGINGIQRQRYQARLNRLEAQARANREPLVENP